jgi:hypothetical protein
MCRRVVPVHFPRTHEQAQKDLERLDLWDNSIGRCALQHPRRVLADAAEMIARDRFSKRAYQY